MQSKVSLGSSTDKYNVCLVLMKTVGYWNGISFMESAGRIVLLPRPRYFPVMSILNNSMSTLLSYNHSGVDKIDTQW